MKLLSAVLGQFAGGDYAWWCPGCNHAHHVPALTGRKVEHSWNFNGKVESPSFTPSVRHFFTRYRRDADGKLLRDAEGKPLPGEEVTTCHYFITDGKIAFCGDCNHALSGKTVPMVPLADHADYGWPP